MPQLQTDDGCDPYGSHSTLTVIDGGQEDLADLIAGMEGMSQQKMDHGKHEVQLSGDNIVECSPCRVHYCQGNAASD